jgi:hypothetical protein
VTIGQGRYRWRTPARLEPAKAQPMQSHAKLVERLQQRRPSRTRYARQRKARCASPDYNARRRSAHAGQLTI